MARTKARATPQIGTPEWRALFEDRNLPGDDMSTCTNYESAAFMIGAGRRLAASHSYKAQDIDWKTIHWDYVGRLFMDAAYHLAICEREGSPMVADYRACLQRFIDKYRSYEKINLR